LKIPDDVARRLSATVGDLSRRALEALALEEYKCGHLTEAELQKLLGFGTRYKLGGFLKDHGVWIDYTPMISIAKSIALSAWDSDRCSWLSPIPAPSIICL
jgi:hypothetical protein